MSGALFEELVRDLSNWVGAKRELQRTGRNGIRVCLNFQAPAKKCLYSMCVRQFVCVGGGEYKVRGKTAFPFGRPDRNFTTHHFHPVKLSTKIPSSRVDLRTSRTVPTLSTGIHHLLSFQEGEKITLSDEALTMRERTFLIVGILRFSPKFSFL